MANRPKRTPVKDEKFFAAIAGGDTISKACTKAGYKRRTVFEWRAENEEFAALFREADEAAVDRMEGEADRRAIVGTLKPVFYKGYKCGSIREFSDTLLMFRLKAKRPDRYRENSKVEHSGEIHGTLTVLSEAENAKLRDARRGYLEHMNAQAVPTPAG